MKVLTAVMGKLQECSGDFLAATFTCRRFARATARTQRESKICHGYGGPGCIIAPVSSRQVCWLVDTVHCKLGEVIFDAAAQSGDLGAVTWLRESGCEMGDWAISEAARSGNLDVVKYVHAQGCERHFMAIENSIDYRQCDVLEWLLSQKYPMSGYTGQAAAETGDLDLMSRLHGQGCPFDFEARKGALEKGQSAAVQWLDQNIYTQKVFKVLVKEVRRHSGTAEAALWAEKWMQDMTSTSCGVHAYQFPVNVILDAARRLISSGDVPVDRAEAVVARLEANRSQHKLRL